MKLIVGLGNHQTIYANTRHNLGFMTVDYIADALHLKWEKLTSNKYSKIKDASDQFMVSFFKDQPIKVIKGDNVICQYSIFNNNIYLKPFLGMNDSGIPVKIILNTYQDVQNMLVIVDDLDLPVGELKLKKLRHSHHNGVKSIMDHNPDRKIDLLRIGIGSPNTKKQSILDYVLGEIPKPSAYNLDLIHQVIQDYIQTDLDHATEFLNQHQPKGRK